MEQIRIFGLLYMISTAIMYFIAARRRHPLAIPGDVLILKAGRTIYIPIASTTILSLLFYLILRSFT